MVFLLLVSLDAVFSLLSLLQHLSPFVHSFLVSDLEAGLGEVCAVARFTEATKANKVNSFFIVDCLII